MATFENVASKFLEISKLGVTSLEENFDPTVTQEFTASHWNVAIIAVVLYLSMVAFGPEFMSSKKAFDLKYPLAAWNALLCIFSAWGMLRTAPYLIAMLMTKSFEETICVPKEQTWAFGSVGAWVMLMNFSKLFELLDTVFIVLRKKPLMFLHWYHHTTVLLFCWLAYSTSSASGIYFVSMNYTIHAIMYGYYCLTALDLKPKWFPPALITLAQMAQMFVGTFVCAAGWYYRNLGRPCANDYSNLIFGAIMYATYLYLFADFAVRKYILKGPARERKPKAVKAL